MAKISARKLIFCKLLRLRFKCKNNNIKEKRFWLSQTFMGRHSKGEFHVLVKELKVFAREFLFKYIATQHFEFSQGCLAVFVLLFNRFVSLSNFIGWQYYRIIFSALELHFFQLQKGKKVFITRKISYCVLSMCACAKLKIFLSAEKFLKWIPALRCDVVGKTVTL